MAQADQRLAADRVWRAQTELGPIVQLELVERKRAAHVALEPPLATHLAAVVVVEHLKAAAPGRLDAVEHDVGISQQLVRGLAVLVRSDDTDACPDRDRITEDVVGLRDVVERATRQSLALIDLAGAGLNDREFIAPKPGQEVRLAHTAAQPLGHRLQKRIPDRMAEPVVRATQPLTAPGP
jgi:hypothetical protein